MFNTFTTPEFEYIRSADQDAESVSHHTVIVVGAGPVGMAAAIDLAQNDVDVVLLDDNNSVCKGSRAVCYGKRFLDIADRLGLGQSIVDRGVRWNSGRVFFHGDEICHFSNTSLDHHRRSGWLNLQQYHLEELMVDHISTLDSCDLRWRNRVIDVDQQADTVELAIETPEGPYRLSCDYLVACDGAASSVRRLCGLEVKGEIFRNRFLIVDLLIPSATFSPERSFWFSPPFHSGEFTLLQPQADNLWRAEFDLGWDADPQEEKRPEKITERVRAFLGDDAQFELEWASVYTYTCRRLESFCNRRVFFAGDAAHQVAPFSARGASSGIEDIDNLIWKLRYVLAGSASPKLLKSYSEERCFAAEENIISSARSTEFITPKSDEGRVFRDAVLKLAKDYPFARSLVNSGRLGDSPVMVQSSLNSDGKDHLGSSLVPGIFCSDGPVTVDGQESYLLSELGNRFCGLLFIDTDTDLSHPIAQELGALEQRFAPFDIYVITGPGVELPDSWGLSWLEDRSGKIRKDFGAHSGTFYLIRPDQIIAARMLKFDVKAVEKAMARALGRL